MIFVKVDVDFTDHPKAYTVGFEGVGLWLAGLCYSRKHELDGRLPKSVVARWPAADALITRLLATGLWVDAGEDYLIFNYAEKGNETKAQVKERREATRKRVADFRTRNAVTPPVTNAFVPDSVSDLISDPEIPKPPCSPPEPDASPREQDYQRAYEAGIAEGKGSPFAMPGTHRGELHQGILAHAVVRGEKLRGDRLLRWITSQARQFAAWLSKQDSKAIGVYSSYAPRGWLKWLNETPIRSSEVKIAIAAPQPARPAIGGPGVRPANENAAPVNVGALVANLADRWKP